MAKFTCDGKDNCKTEVDVGSANPSFVICAKCNHGQATFNCVDTGNHSCECSACGPSDYPPREQEPIDCPPDDWYQGPIDTAPYRVKDDDEYDEEADTVDMSLEKYDDDIPF